AGVLRPIQRPDPPGRHPASREEVGLSDAPGLPPLYYGHRRASLARTRTVRRDPRRPADPHRPGTSFERSGPGTPPSRRPPDGGQASADSLNALTINAAERPRRTDLTIHDGDARNGE